MQPAIQRSDCGTRRETAALRGCTSIGSDANRGGFNFGVNETAARQIVSRIAGGANR
jgi:hypothetical protein